MISMPVNDYSLTVAICGVEYKDKILTEFQAKIERVDIAKEERFRRW